MRPGRPPASEPAKPLQLRNVLLAHGIKHTDMRALIVYPNGAPLSVTAFSFLINHALWPKTVDVATAKAAGEQFLRSRGVTDDELKAVWKPAKALDAKPAAPAKRTVVRNAKPLADLPAEAAPIEEEATLNLPEYEMLSSAARQQFHLPRNPFVDDVNGPEDVFLSADQRYVRDSMYYAAKHGGFIAIVGESGSGKSTLRRDLADRLQRDNDPIVLIQPQTVDKATLTMSHICHAIVSTLSQEALKCSSEAQARQVQRILEGSMRGGMSHALLIEEAHDLSVATLKYLKRFWEIESGFKKLLGIILIGQNELGDRLDERRNYAAREVIRRCEVARLAPLDSHLEAYLAMKFKRVGVEVASVIDPDAYGAIRARLTINRPQRHVESHVYPLVVHNLLARAMNQAVDLGFARVNAELIARV